MAANEADSLILPRDILLSFEHEIRINSVQYDVIWSVLKFDQKCEITCAAYENIAVFYGMFSDLFAYEISDDPSTNQLHLDLLQLSYQWMQSRVRINVCHILLAVWGLQWGTEVGIRHSCKVNQVVSNSIGNLSLHSTRHLTELSQASDRTSMNRWYSLPWQC